MGDTIFNIGSQTAGRDIISAGTLTINQNSSPADILKLLDAYKAKVNELSISEDHKEQINKQINHTKVEVESKTPDKQSIADNIKNANEVLKQTKTTFESVKDIGVYVGKIASWLGTTAGALGWYFS